MPQLDYEPGSGIFVKLRRLATFQCLSAPRHSTAESNTLESIFSIGFSDADALSTSMAPPGEPIISTRKRSCEKIQNGSEFPELVARNSRNPTISLSDVPGRNVAWKEPVLRPFYSPPGTQNLQKLG
jgi:hypothetical protein